MSVHLALAAISESGDGRNPVSAAGTNAIAYATIAVADEQRTANLIAFAAVRGETPAGRRALREAGVALGLYREGALDHGDRD